MLRYFSYHSDIIFRFSVYDAKIGIILQISKFSLAFFSLIRNFVTMNERINWMDWYKFLAVALIIQK